MGLGICAICRKFKATVKTRYFSKAEPAVKCCDECAAAKILGNIIR